MTGIRRVAVGATISLLAPALLWVSPAFAARSLTATPSIGLIDRQRVHIDGAGFNGSVEVGFCQGIDDGSPDQNDCHMGSAGLTTTSSTGTFSVQNSQVRRLIFVPSLGRTVNCAIESCVIGAAEINDISSTATFTPIEFAPEQPDGLIRRRSDGQITGNDVYENIVPGLMSQTRVHTIEPGGKWTFALRVENDGLDTDEITVTASPPALPGEVRYFVGYYDVTSNVLGSGFTYSDMAPGEIRTLAVQFKVSSDADEDSRRDSYVTFTSNSALSSDSVHVGVVVRTPT